LVKIRKKGTTVNSEAYATTCKDSKSAWNKFDWSIKFKIFFSCMITQGCTPVFKQEKPSHKLVGLCCHIGYTAWICPLQTSICFVQWRMSFMDESLGVITRLWWTWRCGFSRHHKNSTYKEYRDPLWNRLQFNWSSFIHFISF
jgi:hypothetical protein